MKLASSILIACLLISLRAPAQVDDLGETSHRAKELMAEGRFSEAVPLYEQLVRALPDNAGLITNLGMALHMSGQYGKATKQFEAALKLQPSNLPAALFLGSARVQLGQPKLAIPALEKVVRTQPDNRDAQQLLAEALYAIGEFKQSAQHFKKFSELAADKPAAWYGLGRSYEELSQKSFEQLAQIAPGSAYWLAMVADARAKQQQYSSAFYLYRQALAKRSDLPGVHKKIGEIYSKTGHADWAQAENEQERTFSFANCASQKLACEFQQAQYDQIVARTAPKQTAESCYWQALAYNELALEAFAHLGQLPASPQMHELKAEILHNQRRYLDAAQELREALQLSPGDAHLRRQLAISLRLARDYAGAKAILQELIEQQPESADLNYLLGDTLLNLQQVEDALPLLKKAVALSPRFGSAHASLGRAYLQIGDAKSAVPHLKAALDTDRDGALHYQIAHAYQMTGQQELAQVALKEYQKLQQAAAEEKESAEKEVKILPPEPASTGARVRAPQAPDQP